MDGPGVLSTKEVPVKRPTMLAQALLLQAERDLGLSVERDAATLRRRCEHEGLSFLTITLPSLSDALERGLETGLFSCPTSFSRHGSLPRFMGGFFKRVFSKEGRLLPDACPDTVFMIRQVCRFFKKLKIGCTPRREARAAEHFLEVEGELKRDEHLVLRKDRILDQVSGIIWSQVFPEINNFALVCRHGPGATAERRLANERYHVQNWNSRSEFNFPSDLHCYPNYGVAAGFSRGGSSEQDWGLNYLSVREEHPVRIVFVPKTQTAPRVIAIEPSHVQYMQQALKDFTYPVLETHRLTKRSIRFVRQDVNQRLAYSSSIDKRLATLDLKDASDRVHLSLVQRIFKTSGILELLEDSRSLHATLPDGRNVILSKFASMGSAMCFPVEACVFYTLIQSAFHHRDGRIPSSRSIAEYSRSIDIYGDDIIVPVEYTDTVVSYLESYCLKVNVSKSFRFGNFRESCGGDFYKGVAVNPVYARTVPHDDSRHWKAEEVMSWNATADLFYLRGMWLVAQTIRDLLSQVLRRTIPRTRVLGSGVAHASLLFSTHLRYDEDLHCWRQRRLHFIPQQVKDKIDGHESATLLKWGITSHQRQMGFRDVDRAILSDRERASSTLRILLSTSDGGSPKTGDCGSGTSLRSLQDSDGGKGLCAPDLLAIHLAGDEESSRVPGDEVGLRDSRTNCIRPRSPSFFDLLAEEAKELDFDSSVKRGGFKPQRRWVSLAG